MITLRQLRLIGTTRNYEVDFRDDDKPQPLAIIAGQITTGKTAVLEFVDYCLGKSRHPSYVEIQRQARSAQLELELSGELHVIERPLFSNENAAWLHECGLADLDEPHATRKLKVDPAGDSSTLNWLLLSHSDLEGVMLKEAPTKADSGTDPLSFRDVMWLAFLDSGRMTPHQLLHEGAPMKKLKLRQLIEVIFGVHDQELAAMGDRISLLQSEHQHKKAEISSLRDFLAEQQVGDALEIRAAIEEAGRELGPLEGRLERVNLQMRASSDYADSVRERFRELRADASRVAARVRDRESLLSRLLPLQAQYLEDEGKLVFLSQAKQLFDPIDVRVCPACLQDLSETPEIKDGRCSLCDAPLVPDDQPINVEAERAAIRARLREINRYIDQVQSELGSARSEYEKLSDQEVQAQAAVDSDISAELAPFIAERDELVRQIATVRSRISDFERRLGWIQSIDRRTGELGQLQVRLDDLRSQQRKLQENRPDRNVVVADLSRRFDQLLRAFGFPKLDDPEPPYLDKEFVPHVRGSRYDQIGSRGAVTLVALAWELAIFERAIEKGCPHPGFLMVDSPQANLKPLTDQPADEYSNPEIAVRLWHHIAEWTKGPGKDAQLLVVDHIPPPEVANSIVATFSGDPEQPPYGLIENEDGRN